MPKSDKDKYPMVIDKAVAAIDPATAMIAKSILTSLTESGPIDGKPPSIVANIVGSLVGDWVSEWRTRRLTAFITETARVAEKNGIDPNKLETLPNGERYRILDGATKTEDPILSAMWASLLLSDLPETESRERLIRILEDMSGEEAKALTFIFSVGKHAEALQTALKHKAQVISDGYKGQERGMRYRLPPLDVLLSKAEYDEKLSKAEDAIVLLTKEVKDLERGLLIGDIYASRNQLLLQGLIQRRNAEIPDKSDFETYQNLLVRHDYIKDPYEEWGDVSMCDPDAVGAAIDGLHNLIAEHTGYTRNDTDPPEWIQYNNRFNVSPWMLTPLGGSLYDACALSEND